MRRFSIVMPLKRVYRFFAEGVWKIDLAKQPQPKRTLLRFAQFISLLLRNFQKDQILQRASSLAFTTLLAIVPLFGVLFAFLKGFNFHHEVMPQIIDFVTARNPEVSQSLNELTQNVVNYIDATNVATLGFVSFIIILGSVGSLMRACEIAFNAIWQVHRSRPFFVKIRDYTFVLIITPLLLFIGLSVRGAFSKATLEPFIIVRDIFTALIVPYPNLRDSAEVLLSGIDQMALIGFTALNLLPLLILWFLFSFVYTYAPYTRVPLSAGILGGFVGAALWQSAYVMYIDFQFGMVRYNHIYGTLAGLPFTLFWIYISWVIVLFGSQFSYVMYNLDHYRNLRRLDEPSPASRERLAVAIMGMLAQRFHKGEPISLTSLADALEMPEPMADEILRELEGARLVFRAATDDELVDRFLPSRPTSEISVRDILDAVRHHGEEYTVPEEADQPGVRQFLARYERETSGMLEETTLHEIAMTGGMAELPAPEFPHGLTGEASLMPGPEKGLAT